MCHCKCRLCEHFQHWLSGVYLQPLTNPCPHDWKPLKAPFSLTWIVRKQQTNLRVFVGTPRQRKRHKRLLLCQSKTQDPEILFKYPCYAKRPAAQFKAPRVRADICRRVERMCARAYHAASTTAAFKKCCLVLATCCLMMFSGNMALSLFCNKSDLFFYSKDEHWRLMYNILL